MISACLRRVGLILLATVSPASAIPLVQNPSFEANSFGTYPGYTGGTNGTINNWTVTGSGGLNPASGNPFANNGTVPDGTQVAFLQANPGPSTLFQTIAGFSPGTGYWIAYSENARNGGGTGTPDVTVTMDATTIVPSHSVSAVGGSSPYNQVVSSIFTPTATSHTLTFSALSHTGGDSTALIDNVLIVPPVPITALANPDFQLPSIGSGNYQYPPHGGTVTFAQQGGSGWNFFGGSGLAGVTSAFGPTTPPDSSPQIGLIQGGGAYFEQLVSNPTAGRLTVSFEAEGRNGQNGSNPFQLLLDGIPMTIGGQATITPPRGSWQLYMSDTIFLTPGTHDLRFSGVGIAGQDVTTFFNSVSDQFIPIPEPATLALLGAGALALLRRRSRRTPADGAGAAR